MGKRPQKIKDEYDNWFEQQEGISIIITKEFRKRFKSGMLVNLSQAIPFSRDISTADNKILMMDVAYEENSKS